MLATSPDRVPAHTADPVNRAIQQESERSVACFRAHPEEIPNRLEQLDREWDVERALAAGSSCSSLVGLALGFSGRTRSVRRFRLAVGAALVAQALFARVATACPVCESETGVQLRAMLAADSAWHLAVTIAPVPALIAAVVGVRFATPWLLKERGGRDAARREPV